MKPNSVIYISFGSLACIKNEQLMEIAAGLEASGASFIRVVRKNAGDDEEWLPEGMEERTKGKGMVIRGWVPQVLILDHQATGGFLTHCGCGATDGDVADFISREKVEKAVREVLVGEEAEERRRRAVKLAEMAKAAVEEGGSSFNDLNSFIEEFSS
ncbi:unnamed protein product [Microthlaspi erraticum]|uniref:UDP-glycosyltransferases domain-containing protein n=1 Tax=Microthlaspi erraticum TaxID=1685480 RepID=A0A6D2IDZ6_9BRAS|nr:unnamed protein product [Microthlaspi erraticum]